MIQIKLLVQPIEDSLTVKHGLLNSHVDGEFTEWTCNYTAAITLFARLLIFLTKENRMSSFKFIDSENSENERMEKFSFRQHYIQ